MKIVEVRRDVFVVECVKQNMRHTGSGKVSEYHVAELEHPYYAELVRTGVLVPVDDPHTVLVEENIRYLCDCGKGYKQREHDARGLFLCYACNNCRAEKLSKYRPDVLTDANYWTDEPVDPID